MGAVLIPNLLTSGTHGSTVTANHLAGGTPMKLTRTLVAAAALALSLTACAAVDNAQDSATKDTKAAAGGTVKVNNPGDNFTVAQRNAIGAAKDYLSTSAFSRAGLIQQLSSKAGDGYPMKVAVFAVNHIQVDWNAQAVQSAKDYLATSHFSRSGLIEQLSSSAGDQYTHAQAVYAANKVGLR